MIMVVVLVLSVSILLMVVVLCCRCQTYHRYEYRQQKPRRCYPFPLYSHFRLQSYEISVNSVANSKKSCIFAENSCGQHVMRQLFFELMQVSIGQLDCLSRGPSPEEWHALYELAQREAVAGICYHGAVALFEFGLRAPQDLIIDWMSESEKIREYNENAGSKLADFQQHLLKDRIRSSVFSGEGLRSCYGDELFYLRESTSIDVYFTGYKNVAELGKPSGLDVNLMDAITVGKHSWRSRRLEKWALENDEMLFTKDDRLTVPATTMRAVLYMAYLYNRLISRNLSMRDLMDYFFILRSLGGQFEPFDNAKQSIGDVFRQLRLSRFAGGVMWLMQEVFALQRECLPVEPLEEEGRFLMADVLLDYSYLSHWGHLLTHYSWYDLIKS